MLVKVAEEGYRGHVLVPRKRNAPKTWEKDTTGGTMTRCCRK